MQLAKTSFYIVAIPPAHPQFRGYRKTHKPRKIWQHFERYQISFFGFYYLKPSRNFLLLILRGINMITVNPDKPNSKKLLAALFMAFALAACGGGSDSHNADDGGTDDVGNGAGKGDDNANSGTPSASAFIVATLNGAEQKASVDVEGTWILNGEAGNALTGKGTATPPIIWTIEHLKAAVGTYKCKEDDVTIVFFNPGVALANPADAWKIQSTTTPEKASCSVTVEKVDALNIEGSFTATTIAESPTQTASFVFTEGSFKVPHMPAK